jgi:hypothetical protein
MSIEQKTTKLLIVSVLVLCVSIGAYYGAYRQVGELVRKVDEAQAATTLDRSQKDARIRADLFVREVAEEYRSLRTLLVSRKDPTPFLTAVEYIGSAAGVTLEVESVVESALTDKEQAVQLLPSIDMAVSSKGSFEEVYRFLELLEHMPYALTVRSVALSVSDSSALWEVQVTVRVSAQ